MTIETTKNIGNTINTYTIVIPCSFIFSPFYLAPVAVTTADSCAVISFTSLS